MICYGVMIKDPIAFVPIEGTSARIAESRQNQTRFEIWWWAYWAEPY